jgi:hypothetical protein
MLEKAREKDKLNHKRTKIKKKMQKEIDRKTIEHFYHKQDLHKMASQKRSIFISDL